ncbi:hypothetical protein NUW54_g4024 [Trametes sanguinea]|uniref:Uncharacterized protein n=1 Tax=Trametes sanguinea TaxID=158606 RepID=A0ACC1PZ90_9APHY|nr:hypothetical protein NUW54_g4024 [Trametes sanguinea]
MHGAAPLLSRTSCRIADTLYETKAYNMQHNGRTSSIPVAAGATITSSPMSMTSPSPSTVAAIVSMSTTATPPTSSSAIPPPVTSATIPVRRPSARPWATRSKDFLLRWQWTALPASNWP